MFRLNLDKYRDRGVRTLSGRDRGEAVRKLASLDDLDSSEESVTVEIPEDVFSVHASFLLGLFGPSVRRLGLAGFYCKYKFPNLRTHRRNLEEAVTRALMHSSVLGGGRQSDE